MAYIVQVNPVDLQKNVALGLDLPLIATRGTRFQQNYFSIDQAAANAKNLLLTEPGERVMLPDFGCGLQKALFEPLDTNALSMLEARIKRNFQTYLPYIFIQELVLTPSDTNNKLFVKLSISLSPTGVDTRPILIEVNGQNT